MRTGQRQPAAESFPLQYEGRGTSLDVPQDTSLKCQRINIPFTHISTLNCGPLDFSDFLFSQSRASTLAHCGVVSPRPDAAAPRTQGKLAIH